MLTDLIQLNFRNKMLYMLSCSRVNHKNIINTLTLHYELAVHDKLTTNDCLFLENKLSINGNQAIITNRTHIINAVYLRARFHQLSWPFVLNILKLQILIPRPTVSSSLSRPWGIYFFAITVQWNHQLVNEIRWRDFCWTWFLPVNLRWTKIL